MPHGTLDLLRGCNIRCHGCYNTQPPQLKPLAQLQEELRQLCAHRRVHSVTLLGGEPTLHPQLVPLIRYIVAQRIRVALLSNGVLLNVPLLRELRQAGLDLLYVHIQCGQERPDLSLQATLEEARQLRADKAALIARHGIKVGFSMMAYRRHLHELREVVRDVLESPLVSFLLITNYCTPYKFVGLTGDLRSGLRVGDSAGIGGCDDTQDEVRNADIVELMANEQLHPFAYLGSSHDDEDPRWLVYEVATLRTATGRLRRACLRAGLSERLLIRLPYWLCGRYVFYHALDRRVFQMRLWLNALSGGTGLSALRILISSFRPGTMLAQKFIIAQEGPTIRADGTVVVCKHCPDATIRDGRLVPVCLADRIVPPSSTRPATLAASGVSHDTPTCAPTPRTIV